MTLNEWRPFLAGDRRVRGVCFSSAAADRPFAQAPAAVPPSAAAAALAAAKSWGYQLQRIKPEVLGGHPVRRLRHRLFARRHRRAGARRAAEIASAEDQAGRQPARRARLSVDRGGRDLPLLLAAGLGDAALAPPWLAAANKRWRTNYPVRYWHEDWQAIVFARREQLSRAHRAARASTASISTGSMCYQEFEKENPGGRASR